jgi:CRP/FNR family cyclic AMP-dependent transcriptional regulator
MVSLEQLKEIRFFDGFSETQLADIASYCVVKDFAKGDIVSREDDPATHLYFLSKGMLDVLIQLPGGKPVSAITIRPGEMFGWSGLVRPYRFTSSAIALDHSVIITLEAQVVKQMFQKDPELGFEIMERIATIATQRLRDTRQQLLHYIYQQTS